VPSFGDLSARASVGEAFGIELRVASAADLIEMKRVRDSEQDRADIAALERGDP